MDIQAGLTPKQQVEGILATTYITGVYHERYARDILLNSFEKFLPGVPVRFEGDPGTWQNPRFTIKVEEAQLWTFLREVAVRCDLRMGIDDDGSVWLRHMGARELLMMETAKNRVLH